MATSGEEVLESVNNEKMVDLGEEGGNAKDMAPRDDHEDIEMGDVKEAEERKDTEPDVDMDGGEATEQSEILLGNSLTAYKEVVEASDDSGGGEHEEEPGVEEHEEEAADRESQDDEEDVDEGEEGTLRKKTGDDVLKDATNTASEEAINTAAEKLFWFPQGTIKRVMKLDPEVNLVNSEAVFLVSKATEQFVECLALEASNFMGGRKTLVGRDIFSAIESQDCLTFLEGAMED